RAPGVAEGGHVHEVGIARMHADAADLHRLAQAEVRPRLAGVARAVDAVAVGHVAADAALAHAGVNDVRVRGGDRQRADRARLHLPVGHRRPARPAVRGLEDAAARGAHVEDLRLTGDAGHRRDAAAAERADLAPRVAFEQLRLEGRLRLGRLR